MPRFRIDDAFTFHPKVVNAGNAAVGAWARLGAHCAAHLTDGFVSDAIVRMVASQDEIDSMLRVRLLIKAEGGYRIHQYLDYQWSKEDIEADRAEARDRMRKRRSVLPNKNRSSQELLVGMDKRVSESLSVSEGESAERGPLPGDPNEGTRYVVDRWRDVAELVLKSLNEARKRVHPTSRGISASYDSLKHIAGRLEAGKSVADCLHVVEVCEAESRADDASFQWFDAVSPFRPDNFERKSAADPGAILARKVIDRHRAANGRGHARATAAYDKTSDGTGDL